MNHSGNCLLPPLVVAVLFVTGCGGGLPARVLKPTPESLQIRTLQTREYVGVSEVDLLTASAGVIQDLGFIIDESETDLGLIVGSKKTDATITAGDIVLGIVGSMLGDDLVFDDYQKIWVSIVIRPRSENDDKTHLVRVAFHRIVWNDRNVIRVRESLDEPEMYQEFFDLLSQSALPEGRRK